MKIEINEKMEAVVDGENLGFAADVAVNHLDSVADAPTPAESLSHKVTRAALNAALDRVTAANQRADEAEQRAQDSERFRPATDTEIEREAQARAQKVRDEEAIQSRTEKILGS